MDSHFQCLHINQFHGISMLIFIFKTITKEISASLHLIYITYVHGSSPPPKCQYFEPGFL